MAFENNKCLFLVIFERIRSEMLVTIQIEASFRIRTGPRFKAFTKNTLYELYMYIRLYIYIIYISMYKILCICIHYVVIYIMILVCTVPLINFI